MRNKSFTHDMKRIWVVLTASVLTVLTACSAKENIHTQEREPEGRTLIAYFSLSNIVPEGADAVTHATPSVGNTEFAAMEIQRQVGGDLFAIQTVQNYPVSHQECSAIAEEEISSWLTEIGMVDREGRKEGL